MTYQIRDWNAHFENNKSREIDRCSFVCLPNKQHGMGFRRIMAELDGATIYGVWVCIVAACSQQSSPRQGWLTEDGRKTGTPWAAADIALKIGRPTAEVDRCLSVVASPRVGWLAAREVPAGCPSDPPEPPDDNPPATPEGRKEGTEGNGRNRSECSGLKTKATLAEIKLHCAKAGIPDSDAEWFFHKCEGCGWTNNGKPIKSWVGTLTAWKMAGYLPSQKKNPTAQHGPPLKVKRLN